MKYLVKNRKIGEEVPNFTKEDMVEFVEWLNLQYRDLEHTKALEGSGSVSGLIDTWNEQRTKTIIVE